MTELKLDGFLDYKFLSDVEFSPDHKHLGFVVHRPDLGHNNYHSTIWVYNIETKQYRQLTSGGEEKRFLWLNNDTILFSAVRDADLKKKIEDGEKWTVFYAINLCGGEATEYMRVPMQVKVLRPVSPDQFAVVAAVDHYGIDLHSLSGEEKQKAIKKIKEDKDYAIVDELPFWTNGGTFTNKIRDILFLYDRRTGESKQLSEDLAKVRNVVVQGNKILYISNYFEGMMVKYDDILVYDIATGKTEKMIESNTFYLRAANFVGDKVAFLGSKMEDVGKKQNPDLFVSENGKGKFICRHDLGFANTTGSDCRYSGGNYGEISSMRVHGGKIYILSTEDTTSSVKELTLDGKTRNVTAVKGAVDYFDVGAEGVYFIGLRDYKLEELYFADKGQNETQLTTLNEEVRKDLSLSIPERFTFTNEGFTFEGFVIKPVGYDPAKKYPGILEIHGGPKTVFGDMYFHEMQVFANKGYFVFFTNPRGSDGRGDKFADLRCIWGTIDYSDLMAFTDEVLKRYPQIDPGRIGVTGGSYGGFMTNWIIGHTNRFKCAVSQRSIANWITQFGCTDIGYNMIESEMKEMPWENVDAVWGCSPMKFAGNAKTPTLFIHSDQDYRCYMAEGFQMFSSLRYQGIESRLCLFHGENHELSRSGKPRHRIKRLEEMVAWFDKYLG